MKVLIVDDSIDKIDALSAYINKSSPSSHIDTAESISNALEMIKQKDLIYNLIIIDQFLPTRNGEEPLSDGGKILLSEINRLLKTKIPNYIIGFSQYEQQTSDFSKVWKVIKYSPDSNDWQLALAELLYHIKNNNFNKENEINQPTIFTEGLTDKYYLEHAIVKFFPEKIGMVNIKSQKGAGSNWVINQMVSWSHSMFKNEEGEFIRCVGLLDQDDAGIKAKKVLATKAFTENQLKTFKCFELKPIYNTDVLNFYKKGIKIEIDIESLFPITVLKRAEELSYLEMRNPGFIEPPQKWIQFHTSFKEYCKGQGIEDDYFYYLNKVKKIKKDDFRKQVDVSINSSELDNFKLLLNDLFIVLGI